MPNSSLVWITLVSLLFDNPADLAPTRRHRVILSWPMSSLREYFCVTVCVLPRDIDCTLIGQPRRYHRGKSGKLAIRRYRCLCRDTSTTSIRKRPTEPHFYGSSLAKCYHPVILDLAFLSLASTQVSVCSTYLKWRHPSPTFPRGLPKTPPSSTTTSSPKTSPAPHSASTVPNTSSLPTPPRKSPLPVKPSSTTVSSCAISFWGRASKS